MLSFENSLPNTVNDDDDDDDGDLSRAVLGGSWVLDFHQPQQIPTCLH